MRLKDSRKCIIRVASGSSQKRRWTQMTASPHEVTQLLTDWANGSPAACDELMPLVYEELRRLAHRHMRGERPGHTLQTSALVHEAFMRLVDQKNVHKASCTRADVCSV